MGAISASSLYGVTRGVVDAEKLQREEEGFKADQAIRAERLKQEQEQAPLRTRALQMGIDESGERMATNRRLAPLQEEAASLNLKTAKLTNEQQTALKERADKARTYLEGLTEGAKEFSAGGDPQSFIDGLKKVEPKFADATATRNADHSITVNWNVPGKQPITFATQKWASGKEMGPDDAMKLYIRKNMMDPLQSVLDEEQQHIGLARESMKQAGALDVARVRGAASAAGAAARGDTADNKRSDAWYNRQHGQIKSVLDSSLKTTGTAGSFIAGYAHENDAALRGIIEAEVEKQIDEGTPVRAASNAVINDVRKGYDLAQVEVNKSAKALAAKNINPKDSKAVAAAAAAGNPDALRFQQVISAVEKRMGPSVAKYLGTNASAK